MAANKLKIRIITPERVFFEEGADMAILRCTTGDLGIMYGHEPCSVVLDIGMLRILDDAAGERRLAVFGGIAQVLDNVLTILVHDAKWPDELEKALEEADEDQDDLEDLQRLQYLFQMIK